MGWKENSKGNIKSEKDMFTSTEKSSPSWAILDSAALRVNLQITESAGYSAQQKKVAALSSQGEGSILSSKAQAE